MKFLLIVTAAVLVAAVTVIIGAYNKSPRDNIYSIDYGGSKELFKHSKNSYAAGETVTLLFDMVATDTDYSFYINGKSINAKWSQKGNGGYEISFVMPEYDVKLEVISKNSMSYIPDDTSVAVPTEELLANYYHSNTDGGHYELALMYGTDENEESYTRLDVFEKQSSESKEVKKSYPANFVAALECREIADKYGFYSWDIRDDAVSEDGEKVVCKYLAESGKLVRVSTEKIPRNGRNALEEIRTILEKYIK